jgi:FKBP-type peptidyl-prolyl cis-trans isomerase 2
MDAGDEETMTLPPEVAYGDPSADRIVDYDPDEFAEALQGEDAVVGMHVQSQQGAFGKVVRADDEVVRVDFNHELAGETLSFEVEVVDVQ